MISTSLLIGATGIACIGVGLWLIWWSSKQLHHLQELLQKGLTTNGIVAAIETEKYSDDAPTYTYTVVFTTGTGETRRHLFRNSYVEYGMEEKIPLIYHPDQSEKAEMLPLPLHPVASHVILVVFALLIIGCGLVLLILSFTPGLGSGDESALPAFSCLM